ncbi:dienelactone hydrolase family protein [Halolamina salina]|uniref:Dienelactone hydrolase family protein n=1 Tax=Halolamina salina TaxID=1220023 RepID=A0ABD6B2I5_9EURY
MSDSEPIVIPSARDVRANLDEGAAGDDRPAVAGETDACVVACPPHPQQGGHRGDGRLVGISDHLTAAGVDCLRFDYGDWDEGYGELGDTYAAIEWASERYDRIGLTGFSFGACLTLLAAGGTEVDGSAGATPDLAAVAALAPPSRLNDDLNAVPAMERIEAPATVAYGERDDLADWEPVVERAEELGWETTALSADHFFVGRTERVAETIGGFLLDYCASR